jgi:hypothetical protein
MNLGKVKAYVTLMAAPLSSGPRQVSRLPATLRSPVPGPLTVSVSKIKPVGTTASSVAEGASVAPRFVSTTVAVIRSPRRGALSDNCRAAVSVGPPTRTEALLTKRMPTSSRLKKAVAVSALPTVAVAGTCATNVQLRRWPAVITPCHEPASAGGTKAGKFDLTNAPSPAKVAESETTAVSGDDARTESSLAVSVKVTAWPGSADGTSATSDDSPNHDSQPTMRFISARRADGSRVSNAQGSSTARHCSGASAPWKFGVKRGPLAKLA